MSKTKWPDNDSDEAADWDFNKFRRWCTVRLVEAFVFEGSKGVNVEMHSILTTAFEWHSRNLKNQGKLK